MEKFFKFISSNKYYFILIFVCVIAIGLRLYRFNERWGLGSDDIRDISIAKEALARGELPLIGSFSSAGPFVFGPLFYWFIMASYLFLPFTFLAPWISLTILGLLTVCVLMYSGYLIGGKKLSIVIGLLAATSPQLILRSIALNQHSIIGITTALVILNYILFWKKRALKYVFFLGVSLGIALSMHYQAINLFIFFPLVLLMPKIGLSKKLIAVVLMFFGFIIPAIPMLIWDSRQNLANIRNIIDYLLIGQYRIYVPNSWRLFIFNYLPNFWAFAEGGYHQIATFLLFLTGLLFVIFTFVKRISGVMFILIVAFFLLLIVNRYYRGERFEGYFMYITPFIIIFSGWIIDQLFSFKSRLFKKEALSRILNTSMRGLGISILLITTFGNLLFSSHILLAQNREKEIRRIERLLLERYSDKKISLYDYSWSSSDKSYPLSAFLKEKNKTDAQGVPVGIIWKSRIREIDEKGLRIITSTDYDLVVELSKEKTFNTKKNKWVNVNQERIYDDLMKWTKTEKLTSSFSFFN